MLFNNNNISINQRCNSKISYSNNNKPIKVTRTSISSKTCKIIRIILTPIVAMEIILITSNFFSSSNSSTLTVFLEIKNMGTFSNNNNSNSNTILKIVNNYSSNCNNNNLTTKTIKIYSSKILIIARTTKANPTL